MNWRSLIWRTSLIAALALAIIWFGLHRELLQPAALARELRRFGGWAPLVFIIIYALGTVLFAPGSLLTLAGGAIFGPIWGTLWNLTGATLGATLAFLLARNVASAWVAARSGENLDRLMRGVDQEGWRFVAFVRLVPLFPFNLINYALGLTRIGLRDYVLASFICMAPGAFAYTYLGYAGREAAAGQRGIIQKAVIALALLALVAFLPRLVRRFRSARLIDAESLRQQIEAEAEVCLIDVRTPEEFTGPLGHIAGAINVPLPNLAAEIPALNHLKQKPVVLV